MNRVGSSDGLLLRAITPEDEDFLYRLYASTREDEMALVDWDEAQKQDFLRMQFRAQSQHYHQHFKLARFDIIEYQGAAVGRLYVDRRADEIRIIDIALLPGYRGRGIGGHYLQSLLDEAAASGKSLSIHVEHNNPAMRLYQRLGFERVRDEGVYWFMRWPAGPASAAGQENTAS